MKNWLWFAVCLLVFSFLAHADNGLTAAQQSDATWQNIFDTSYEWSFPEMVSPGKWESLNLLDSGYNAKVFQHRSDVMMQGRAKLIHGFGTSIKVSFVKHANSPYTGIFEGAPYALLRVSLAVPPSSDIPPKLVPGLAIKFFVDGKDSLNLMAMPSLDGQFEQNIFTHDYGTNLAKPAWSMLSWLIENRFSAALSHVGQPNGNPRSFSLDHLANIQSSGELVSKPKAPFALLLSASNELKEMYDSQSEDDFRKKLNNRGNDMVLFRVFAIETVGQDPVEIGKILSRSNFMASEYSDKQIFFRHPKMHTLDDSEKLNKPEL